MGQFWSQFFAWGLFDDASIFTGLIYAVLKFWWTDPAKRTHAFFSAQTGKVAAHGMSLLPLGLLFVAAVAGKFSKDILVFLLGTSRVVLALSAVFAIFAIVGDD